MKPNVGVGQFILLGFLRHPNLRNGRCYAQPKPFKSINSKIPKAFIACHINNARFNGKMGKFFQGILFIAQHLTGVGFEGGVKG
jgi:hypothetical protein